MTKSELLADLATKGLRVIQVEEIADAAQNAAGVRSYVANVLEQSGISARARNVGFYVVDEGDQEELAYYRDNLKPKNALYDAAKAYLDGLVPGTYIRAELRSVDEEKLSALASAYKDNGDGTCSVVEVLIYKNNGSPATHIEVV